MFLLPSGVVVRQQGSAWVIEYDWPQVLAPHEGEKLKARFG